MSTGPWLVGRFRLDQLLGHGALGEVWRAFDVLLGRDVAVKRLRVTDHDLDTLRAEFRAAVTVRHPHIVEVFDLIARPGAPAFFSMELLDALPFDVAAAGLPPHRVLALAAQALSALAHLGAHGLVHGDLKPTNLLVDRVQRATVTLVDFGLATTAGAAGLCGTPDYLAPEVIAGGRGGPAAELYALGVVLYEALTGTNPFAAGDAVTTLRRHLDLAPAPAHHLCAGLEPAVGAFVARLLAKDPRARFPSYEAALDALVALTARDARAASHERAPSLATPPLVGRENALMALVVPLSQLDSGEGATVTYAGAAGCGRSRLAATVRLYAELDGRPTGAARLTGAPADVDQLLAAIAAVTGTAPDDSDADMPRPSAARALDALAGRLASTPAVLVVDDADRAHPSAVALLGRLVQLTRAAPLMLGLTTGPPGDPPSPLHRTVALAVARGHAYLLPVAPLDADATEALIAGALGGAVDTRALATPLHHASGGNPAALVALLEQLATTHRLHLDQGRWALVPSALVAVGAAASAHDALGAAFAAQVAGAEPALRNLWRAVAALGTGTADEIAAVLADNVATTRAALARAVAQRTVTVEPGHAATASYRIARSWLSSAVLDAETPHSFHCLMNDCWRVVQCSNAAPTGDGLLRLARVSLAAGRLADAGVVVPAAAARAEAAGDAAGALALWQGLAAALGADGTAEARRQAYAAIARLTFDAGRYGEALTALAAADEAGPAPDDGAAVEALRLVAEALGRLGRSAEARAAAAALRVAGAALPDARARGRCALAAGRVLRLAGDANAARAACEEALAGGTATLGDAGLASALMRELATLAWQAGQAERAVAFAREAVTWAEATTDLRAAGEAAMCLGTALRTAGRSEEAVALYESAADRFERAGALASLGKARNNLGVCHHLAGRVSDAAAAWQAALSVAETTGERDEQVILLNNLGYMYLERGAHALAEQSLEEALTLASDAAAEALRLAVLGNVADLRLQQGQLAGARRALGEALALAQRRGARGDLIENTRRLAELELREGHPAEAARVARTATEEASALGLAREHAHLLRVEAVAELRCGDLGAAQTALRRADATGALAAGSVDAQLLSLARAELLLARGELTPARTLVAAASAALTTLGAAWHADEARQLEARVKEREAVAPATTDPGALERAFDLLDASADPESAARHALTLALAASEAEHGTVYLAPTAAHDALRVSVVATRLTRRPDPDIGQFSRTVAQRVLETGETTCLHRIEDDARVASAQSVVALRLRSVLCVAVPVEGRAAGLLYLDSRVLVGDRFERAVPFVERLARLLGMALERLWLRDRVASQHAVLSVVAHELRSPLTSILGFGELAAARPPEGPNSPSDDLVAVVLSEGRRMRRLLDDVQALGRAWRVTLDEAVATNPRSLLDAAAHHAGPAAQALGVRMSVVVDDAAAAVLADRERVQQVLANLIENALRYAPRGSVVTLSCAREPFHGAVGERRAVRLSVADEGVGIGREDAVRIFQRFDRGSRPRGEGTGLGLSVAQSIVLAHGGRLWAEAHEPGGRLHFTLPLAPTESGP